MATYPTATATFRVKENLPGLVYTATDKTTLFVEDLTKLEDEVIAIEETLGAEVQGTFETLAARLDDVDTNIDNVDGAIATAVSAEASARSAADTAEAAARDAAIAAALSAYLGIIYPVGAIYMSVVNTNPATLFGGTWAVWGAGRVPVGVDAAQSEFDAVEEQGGHKLMQSHTHGFRYAVQGSGGGVNNIYGMPYSASANGSVVTQSGEPSTSGELRSGVLTNGGGNAQNLQPYITCYMWKRTA